MKAVEVLEQYDAGERNFHRANLQGQSFKAQNLSRADFSRANIRGADFTNANLTEAKFRLAEAGLSCKREVFLVTCSWIIAGTTGYFADYATYLVSHVREAHNSSIFYLFYLSILAIFVLITKGRGLEDSLATFAIVTVIAIAVGAATNEVVSSIIAVSSMTASAIIIAVAVAVNDNKIASVVATVFISIWGELCGGKGSGAALAPVWISHQAFAVTELFFITVVIAITLFSSYIGWRAMAGDDRYTIIRKIAVTLASVGGTNFYGADLTDADFTSAKLKSTNFEKAILTRTCWNKIETLEHICPGRTYLRNKQLRQCLIENDGHNKNFDRQDLRRVNLRKANLTDASFIGADLSEANLQDADLSRAKLVKTQLDRTDLTRSTLTGACIEDWGITSHTKLDGVRCEYVFMRLETKDDPNRRRKPDNSNETFQVGDFADFIKPIADTLDLYHNQNVDPRTIAISFKQLADNHPEAELEIVAMEKRGGDKLLLRAKTAPEANPSELSAEYFSTYNQLKSLPGNALIYIIADRDRQIRMLAGQVDTALKTAIERYSIYAETYHHRGDNMSDKSSDIKIGDVSGGIGAFADGDISGVAGQNMTGVAGGDISGSVTAAISQLQASDTPEAPQLADLLKQLQTAVESESKLNDDDRDTALEQVKVLVEAGQKPKEGAMQKAAKTAILALKGIVSSLPDVAKLAEASKTLLPMIAKLFGV